MDEKTFDELVSMFLSIAIEITLFCHAREHDSKMPVTEALMKHTTDGPAFSATVKSRLAILFKDLDRELKRNHRI